MVRGSVLARVTKARIARRGGDRGAVAVEFALVLPLLMLIVFGIIQFGVVMTQSAALASAARTGARHGVVNIVGSHTCADVVEHARRSATTIGMSGASVAVSVRRATAGGSTTTICESSAGSTVVSNPTELPCASASDLASEDNDLYVTAAFTSKAIVPVGLGDFSLSGDATYRCEYQ